MFHESFIDEEVLRMFRGHFMIFKGVCRVFQGSFNGECFKGDIRVFQCSLKGISKKLRKFPGCFEHLSRKF